MVENVNLSSECAEVEISSISIIIINIHSFKTKKNLSSCFSHFSLFCTLLQATCQTRRWTRVQCQRNELENPASMRISNLHRRPTQKSKPAWSSSCRNSTCKTAPCGASSQRRGTIDGSSTAPVWAAHSQKSGFLARAPLQAPSTTAPSSETAGLRKI